MIADAEEKHETDEDFGSRAAVCIVITTLFYGHGDEGRGSDRGRNEKIERKNIAKQEKVLIKFLPVYSIAGALSSAGSYFSEAAGCFLG